MPRMRSQAKRAITTKTLQARNSQMHRLILLIPMGRAACGQDASQLPETGQIELAIYNLAGQQVAQ